MDAALLKSSLGQEVEQRAKLAPLCVFAMK
jgi:hypothetical protein